jgi:hypothetical protein
MGITRWARRRLRSCGIDLPFAEVICPEHIKSISIDAVGRARVTLTQKLVFLQVPRPGDLRDVCDVDSDTTFDNFILQSTDAVETGRTRRGPGSIVVDWEPRSGITPYALYEHQQIWFPAGSYAQPALWTEFHCEVRTGVFRLEMYTPESFEAAVVFERPRWPILNSERRVVKYALRLLDDGGERATIVDEGQRINWKVVAPKVGTRYICVGFHQHGVLLCRNRLTKTSIAGRLRRLTGRVVPG